MEPHPVQGAAFGSLQPHAEAQARQLDSAQAVQQNIGGLQIAVDDALQHALAWLRSAGLHAMYCGGVHAALLMCFTGRGPAKFSSCTSDG